MNSGYLQASIAYSVRQSDGAPLDINGQPVAESGNRQAIALLEGTANPDPSLYDVAFYFPPGAVVSGNPTELYAPEQCPVGSIYAMPGSIFVTLAEPQATITLYSSHAWIVDSYNAEAFTLDTSGGPAGTSVIIVGRGAAQGQGPIIFINTVTGQTAEVYATNVDALAWILDTGIWNDLGVWTPSGIWNF